MRIISIVFCLLVVISPVVLAQSEKNFVSVPVTVSDRQGRYISGLKEEDFKILEGDQEQKVTFFATEDEPISVALLLDTSESTKDVLDKIRDAAKDFVGLLNEKDQCLVATFDSEVKILSPFTSDHGDLKKSLDKIQTADREGTVFFNAVEQITRDYFVKVKGRKVIVMLSDGKDYRSSISKKELLSHLEESDVLIYSIFYQTGKGFEKVVVDADGAVKEGAKPQKLEKPPNPETPAKEEKPQKKKKKKQYTIQIGLPRDTYTPEEIKLSDKVASIEAINILQEMSDTTAGRFYLSDTPNLGRIFKEIAAELREQYRLGFYTKKPDNDETVNNIIVRVNRPDAVVRARGKYRAKKL